MDKTHSSIRGVAARWAFILPGVLLSYELGSGRLPARRCGIASHLGDIKGWAFIAPCALPEYCPPTADGCYTAANSRG